MRSDREVCLERDDVEWGRRCDWDVDRAMGVLGLDVRPKLDPILEPDVRRWVQSMSFFTVELCHVDEELGLGT